MRLFFDANVLIALVESDGATKATLEAIVYHEKQGLQIFISDLSAVEVLVGPLRLMMTDGGSDDRVLAAYLSFFDRSSPFRRLPASSGILVEAARLRAERIGLKTPDAVHLAVAMAAQCEIFVTNDRSLRSIAAEKGLEVCSLEPSDLDALLARIATAP